jgi:hypothetical protein
MDGEDLKNELEMAKEDIAGRVQDEEFRNETESALDDICRILGDKFDDKGQILREGFIYEIVFDGTVAEEGYRRLIRFADMLREFEENDVFLNEIKPRLQTPSEIFDAYRELEAAYLLRERNFDADFMERDPDGGSKTPDLLVDSEIEIEIKNLRTPDHFDEQIQRRNMLIVPNLSDNLEIEYQFHSSLISENRMSEIVDKVSEAKKKAAEDGKPVRVSFEGVEKEFEAIIAPEDKKEAVEEWKEEHDSNARSYPDINEHVRILRKINKASEQFTGENRNVLLAYTQALRVDNQSYQQFIQRLEKEVYDNPDIDSLIVSVSVPEVEDIPFERKKNYRIYRHHPDHQVSPMDYIIVHDRYAEDKDYQSKLDLIFRPVFGGTDRGM